MSSKSKGDKHELILKKILENHGWTVMKSPRTMRFIGPGRFISQANDFFGYFDLVAKKGKMTRWIQVKADKTGSHVSTAKKPIADFARKHHNAYEHYEIAWKQPRKKWIILTYCEAYDDNKDGVTGCWSKKELEIDVLE